jgi:hypothetical protein
MQTFPFITIAVAAIGVWLFVIGQNSPIRSRRLGLFALAAGMIGFAAALLAPVFKDENRFLAAAGIACVLFGVLACILAVWSFGARRRSGPGGLGYGLAGIVVGLINCLVGAFAIVNSAGKIEAALDELAAGRGDWKSFSVKYDDLHGFHGGLTLTIHGDGRVEQHAVPVEARETRQVAKSELERLVALLREIKV